eukprot:g70469.t1
MATQSQNTGQKVTKHRCHYCQKCFSRSVTLKTHIRIHTGEKPFNCPYCQRAFARKCDMKHHMLTHTGEKPYKCHLCPKSFRQSGQRTAHIRIHTGVKPYSCKECNRCFARKSDLLDHQRIHTGERPYKCEYCGKAFIQSGTYSAHLRTHVDPETGERVQVKRPIKKNATDLFTDAVTLDPTPTTVRTGDFVAPGTAVRASAPSHLPMVMSVTLKNHNKPLPEADFNLLEEYKTPTCSPNPPTFLGKRSHHDANWQTQAFSAPDFSNSSGLHLPEPTPAATSFQADDSFSILQSPDLVSSRLVSLTEPTTKRLRSNGFSSSMSPFRSVRKLEHSMKLDHSISRTASNDIATLPVDRSLSNMSFGRLLSKESPLFPLRQLQQHKDSPLVPLRQLLNHEHGHKDSPFFPMRQLQQSLNSDQHIFLDASFPSETLQDSSHFPYDSHSAPKDSGHIFEGLGPAERSRSVLSIIYPEGSNGASSDSHFSHASPFNQNNQHFQIASVM